LPCIAPGFGERITFFFGLSLIVIFNRFGVGGADAEERLQEEADLVGGCT
jgi:hypothetical protein